MKNRKLRLIFPIIVLVVIFFAVQPAEALIEIGNDTPADNLSTSLPDLSKKFIGHTEEDVVKVYDKDGNHIFSSCMGVHVGDRYINEANKEYKVIKIDGDRGVAEFVKDVDLMADIGFTATSIADLPPLAAKDDKKMIGLYHTHSAESYTPGPAFTENQKGEIYSVGETLKKQFEKKGIEVVQSEKSFLPHDGAAYDRSRPTAKQLVQKGPAAVFDVHRDAIPRPEEYLKEVNGEKVSQVRLVVGRQNPNREPNDKMAKRLKAVADEKYPGLIKGIFYAKGKYNQDLSPKALLLEFGTHVTQKDQAQKSTTMMADSINTMLFGANAGQGTDRAIGNAGWRNALIVLGVVIAAIIGFLFLNEGGISGVSNRLKEFSGEEFANMLGRRKRDTNRRKNRDKDKE